MGSDYTACNNTNCPIKHSCHRFTGPRNEYRQSVFIDNPCEWYDNWFYCEYFWDNQLEPETMFEKAYWDYIDDLINEVYDKR